MSAYEKLTRFVCRFARACMCQKLPKYPFGNWKKKSYVNIQKMWGFSKFRTFAQYLKNLKNTNWVLLSIELQARLKPGTLLKAPLWVFFTFFETVKMVLNCAKRLRCKANTPLILSRQNAMLIVINIYSNITIGFEISVSPSRNAILLLLLLSLLLLLLS